MRESLVESYLCERVRALGGIAYKFTSPGHRSVPDRLVLLPGGILFFVECKATGQRATAAQTKEHEKMRVLGFKVYVVCGIEAVDGLIRGWK